MDGRPDMRFKENRIAGKNKDGSDDMRFKENRIAGKNKDGSDDMRYKRNREPDSSEQSDLQNGLIQSLIDENQRLQLENTRLISENEQL